MATTIGSAGGQQKIVQAASKWIGTPYVFTAGDASGPTRALRGCDYAIGGCNAVGFDCSGLTLYAYAQIGVTLPHYTVAQANIVKAKGDWNTDVSQLVPGDLIFFTGSDGTHEAPGHVGIYLGSNQMLNAPQSGEACR